MTDEARAADKPTVFISDPSVEAERITQALRAAQFHVVDVPLSMLVARVAVQRPRVVILDADADGALDAVARMRELPDAESIDVVFCGRPGATLSNAEDALAHEGSGFFSRPVSVATLLKKVESLVQGESPVAASMPPPAMSAPSSSPPSRPPLSQPPSRPPPSVQPPSMRGPLSQRVPPPSIVSRELAEILLRAEESDLSMPGDMPVPSPEEEIQAVLPEEVLAALDAPLEGDDDGDEIEGPSRVTTSGGRGATTGVREPAGGTGPRTASVPPEPLTHDGSASAHQTQGEPVSMTGTALRTNDGATTAHGAREAQRSETLLGGRGGEAPHEAREAQRSETLLGGRGGEAPHEAREAQRSETLLGGRGGEAPHEAPARPQPFTDPTAAITTPPRRSSSIPPPTHLQPTPSVLSTTLGSELLVQQGGMIGAPPLAPFGQPASQVQSSGMPLSPAPPTFEEQLPAQPKEPSGRAGSVPRTQGPYQLGFGDAARMLGQAIATRQTGALAFDAPTGVRRIVLREGDIVTAASGVDAESLLAFLGARGDLPRERVEALSGRLPPYGRHAGAALVAQGALGQEQLWPVLRAHAEYLMGRVLLVEAGNAMLEAEPQGRLKTEPSVFGGAPGAGIFVEVVRRVVASHEAMRLCGGGSSVVGEGTRPELLRECGLGAAEVEAIRMARGQRLDALTAAYPDGDMASVVYALWLLGVVEMVRSVLERPALGETKDPDAIDEDAVRDRIRARLELVDEGDYFALLGIPHSATNYEVRRAYLDLRRAFEPSRVLTPALIDLAEDVRRITSVLEEAYEILGDNARRERYRRAIDASPQS